MEGMNGLFDFIPWDDAPMPLEHWEQYARHVARIEIGGNDGADIWEFEEWARNLAQELPWWGGDINSLLNEMETWVMRKMGSAFDPEKHCAYTGRRLWQFPSPGWDGRYMMGYFREPDAYLMRVRDCTPGEMEWITGNPAAFAKAKARFEAWRDKAKLSDLDG
jgi:hypothetical protein